MLDLFDLLLVGNDGCGGLKPIVAIIKNGIFPIVQIGVPLLLIVLGTVDLGKAVISSDEKEVKKAQSTLIKRCIYGVAIFFIVTLVTLVMNLVATGAEEDKNADDIDSKSWFATCWDKI